MSSRSSHDSSSSVTSSATAASNSGAAASAAPLRSPNWQLLTMRTATSLRKRCCGSLPSPLENVRYAVGRATSARSIASANVMCSRPSEGPRSIASSTPACRSSSRASVWEERLTAIWGKKVVHRARADATYPAWVASSASISAASAAPGTRSARRTSVSRRSAIGSSIARSSACGSASASV